MPFLVWFVWFGVYLRTLSPGLGGEDSGEFATLAATMGISHPPGYPLYALAGRLISLVPLGSPAFRLNLFSAACAAGALAILFSLVRREAQTRWRLGEQPAVWAALAATLVLGFSQAMWREAVISDKYPLNLLLFSAVAWSALVGPRPEATALFLGLGFSHHLQTLYLLPGLAFLAWRNPAVTGRRAMLCALVFLLGLSPKIIFPPVRGMQDPALVLGRASTAGQWYSYARAEQYRARIGGPGALARVSATAGTMGEQTRWAGTALGLAGLAAWSAGAGPAGAAVWLTAACGFILASVMAITGREFYLLPVAWILAFGFGCLLAWAGSAGGRRRWLAVSGVFPVFLLAWNLPWGGSGRVSPEYEYGRDLLAGLPPRSVLFTGGDDVVYPVFYLQEVEGFRGDITAIPEGFLSFGPTRERLKKAEPGLAGALREDRRLRTEDEWGNAVARHALSAGRRVFVTGPGREDLSSGFVREGRDLVIEVLSRPGRGPAGGILWMRARGWYRNPAGLTERQRHLLALYALYQKNYADFLLNTGRARESLSRYRLALSNDRLNGRGEALENYALALEKCGDRVKAAEIRAINSPR